jgi:hypothetical protein
MARGSGATVDCAFRIELRRSPRQAALAAASQQERVLRRQ